MLWPVKKQGSILSLLPQTEKARENGSKSIEQRRSITGYVENTYLSAKTELMKRLK